MQSSKYKGYKWGEYQATSVQCPRCLVGHLLVKRNVQLRQIEYFIRCEYCDEDKRPLRVFKSINYI
ncbi:hypothetical protein [Photobacterium piscicola]|uniref:hypothetical protein n=1 Tax=Photobacterium piscicola TaxID=1378299 RepID=UPI0037360DC5